MSSYDCAQLQYRLEHQILPKTYLDNCNCLNNLVFIFNANTTAYWADTVFSLHQGDSPMLQRNAEKSTSMSGLLSRFLSILRGRPQINRP